MRVLHEVEAHTRQGGGGSLAAGDQDQREARLDLRDGHALLVAEAEHRAHKVWSVRLTVEAALHFGLAAPEDGGAALESAFGGELTHELREAGEVAAGGAESCVEELAEENGDEWAVRVFDEAVEGLAEGEVANNVEEEPVEPVSQVEHSVPSGNLLVELLDEEVNLSAEKGLLVA